MKLFKKAKPLLGGVVLSVALVASSLAGVSAIGSQDKRDRQQRRGNPPTSSFSQGPQDKHPVEPGTVDAKEANKLGKTNEVETTDQQRLSAQTNTSIVSSQDPQNYCYKNLVYVPVTNHSSSTQSIQVTMYNKGGEHAKYATVAAGQTAYVAYYGIEGEYATYLYYWDGSMYQYVDNKHSEHICRVAVTRTYNTNGWVQLRIQNAGTAYVTQKSSQLAPNAGVGDYTGTHHDQPVAGGEAIYRWFDVSGGAYGIVSETYGGSNSPFFFTGNRS